MDSGTVPELNQSMLSKHVKLRLHKITASIAPSSNNGKTNTRHKKFWVELITDELSLINAGSNLTQFDERKKLNDQPLTLSHKGGDMACPVINKITLLLYFCLYHFQQCVILKKSKQETMTQSQEKTQSLEEYVDDQSLELAYKYL